MASSTSSRKGPTLVVHQSDEVLDAMDEWNTSHHGQSGLTQRVRESTVDEAQASAALLAFLAEHTTKKKAPLAGNSIHQDRRFVARYLPEVEDWLHYRNVDVSTIKELAQRWYPKQYAGRPTKKGSHRAMDDLMESIEELKYYRKALFLPPSHEARSASVAGVRGCAGAAGRILRPPSRSFAANRAEFLGRRGDRKVDRGRSVPRSLRTKKVVYVGERHDQPATTGCSTRSFGNCIGTRRPSRSEWRCFRFRSKSRSTNGVPGSSTRPCCAATPSTTSAGASTSACIGRSSSTRAIVASRSLRSTRRGSWPTPLRRDGVDSLSQEQASALPELDLANEQHRALFDAEFDDGDHAVGDAVDRYYQAQVLWDETMGSRVAETLGRDGGPAKMIVFAGRVHVKRGLGIPDRAAKRGAAPYAVVLPVTDKSSRPSSRGPPKSVRRTFSGPSAAEFPPVCARPGSN